MAIDMPAVTATLKGEIGDLLAKLKLAQEAIKEFKRTASSRTDLRIASDMEKELARIAKMGKSGIIRDAVKKMSKDAELEADKAGKSLAGRFAASFRNALKKEKFRPPGWLPWVGAGLLPAPAAISGILGVVGGLGTAFAGAAAGLGALGAAAVEVLGPVKQAFQTIDQMGVTNKVPANATALQIWLKSGKTSGGLVGSARTLELARLKSYQAQLAAAGTPAQKARLNALVLGAQTKLGMSSTGNTLGNLGFLANPNVNWYTLNRRQQRNLVLQSQNMTGLPASEKAQITALMAERQAYSKLNPAQQGALFQYTKFDAALVANQQKAQPAVLGVFAGGLQTITPLLKYIAPLANAAYAALMPLMNTLATGFKSTGFANFMKLLQGQATMAISGFGKAAINFGIGLAHIFSGFAKSGLSSAMVSDIVKMSKAFANWTGSKAFTEFMSQMKANGPIVVDILKQLFQILGHLITNMGGGLSTAALRFLDLLLRGLDHLANIPGIGPFVYNMTAFILLFSKFGTLKAAGAIFDLLYRSLGKLVALKVGSLVAGMLGLETEGMGLAKMWQTIGKAVLTFSKDMVVAAAQGIKTAALWLVRTIAQAAGMAAAWIASAAASVAAWVAANAAMIALSGGIVLAIGAIVVGIFFLLKHWKTVWGFIKRIAEDAWKFIVNGWGKYLLPFLGPVGLLVLGIIEVWKHWKTIWHDICAIVDGARKLIEIAFLRILLQAAGWAKTMVHLAADAFSWIPGLGKKLKAADTAIGNFIKSTQAQLNKLTKPHNVPVNIKVTAQDLIHVPGSKHGIFGFAAGTSGAAPGWAMVGEQGPELVHMRGGETVVPNHKLQGYAGGTGYLNWQFTTPSAKRMEIGFASINALADKIGHSVATKLAVIEKAALIARIKQFMMSRGPGAHGGPTSANAAQAQAYARSRLAAYGWPASQMGPLIALWNQESGWNRFARNPTSGAYGIPQALPPGKMGAAANPPQSSAAAQINWGLGYIRSVYGSPANAEAHELAHHWYGYGGYIPRGGMGIVGDRGIERVRLDASGGATVTPIAGGTSRNVNVNVFTNEINPRYHAAQLGFELARRSA